MPELATPDDQYAFLLDNDVFVEADGGVATTEAFESARRIYRDTYADLDDEAFHETIASLFGLPVEEAREQVDRLGVTRAELVAYLSLQSYLGDVAPDVELDPGTLVQLAGMVAGVAPESPVPDGMVELGDDYRAFLEANPDAVVFVWKLHCDPCDAMKRELDETLGSLPDGVTVAGVDGETADAFRREFEVDAAPTTLVFADGELVDRGEGRQTVDQLEALFEAAYGSASAVD